MGYCEPESLLLGQIKTADGEREQFVEIGAEEMDVEIGLEYVLPLQSTSSASIPARVTAYLAKCNRMIASGRLILARNAATDDSLHAYGLSLLREGQDMLASIRQGRVQLEGLLKIVNPDDIEGVDGPVILHTDSVSGLDAYSDWFHDRPLDRTSGGYVWVPGE